MQERHAAKTVGDIKQFVSKLPHMQAAKSSLATRKFEGISFV
jgi:vacuolar protein sorting-associated protein 33A